MELTRPDGSSIRGTNVVDLLSNVVTRRKLARHERPLGYYDLKPVLLKHNIPKSLVNNTSWLDHSRVSMPPATPYKSAFATPVQQPDVLSKTSWKTLEADGDQRAFNTVGKSKSSKKQKEKKVNK